MQTALCEIMGRHGSDKGSSDNSKSWHNYTVTYYKLFNAIRNETLRVFELGLGTNNLDVPSNMGLNGRPGASLRGWREFFPNSEIFGADIDRRVLFEESRIQTFYCDQTSPDAISGLWSKPALTDPFHIIVDDGLHAFAANVCFFENSIHKLMPGGFYIIEDILKDEIPLFKEKVQEWVQNDKYNNLKFTLMEIPSERNPYDNNLLVIEKNGFNITGDMTHNLSRSLRTIYTSFPKDKTLCVEIGSFEGIGSVLIANSLCSHPNSRLLCIDPFDDEYVKGDPRMSFWDHACKNQYFRFIHNTCSFPKIIPHRGTSDAVIPSLEDGTVDFVYIDGDHSPEQVYKDAVNILPKMKSGGVILFDDYEWDVNGMKTSIGIDKFLADYPSHVILLKNYQLAIRVV